MTVDAFTDRLARVRHRFVSTLDSKIEDAYATIAKLPANGPTAAESVAETYRIIHGIVGIGPTVGFPATGRAAKDVENVLRSAYQGRRGLTDDEISQFKKRLYALREAGSRELQAFYAV